VKALGLAIAPLLLAASTQALAAATPALAKAGDGQQALAVGFDDKGTLRAAPCTTQPCSLAGGVDLGVPGDYAGRAQQTTLSVVPLGRDRRAVVVTIPSALPDRAWQAVVAAPLGGGAPLVLFAGETGWVSGPDGERRGPRVEVSERDEDGARHVLVGEQWENLSLCGRPAILSPTLLDARTMKLARAKVQRLSAEERASATPLVAEPISGSAVVGPPLLRATGATSATGDPHALSDGKPETAWSENVSGGGKGEFVRLDVPGDLPLQSVELVFQPTSGAPAKGTAPRELWLVAAKNVYKVTIPGTPWQPGARYAVKFDKPLVGDCLALVLESAVDESRDAVVTVAEISAQTQFGDADVKALVAALSGGAERAQDARRILQTLGQPAYEAAAAAFEGLDEGGRREALEIVDAASCEISVPVYMQALTSPFEGQRTHARTRLRRCGEVAARALAEALPNSSGAALEDLASELALIAPAQAVQAMLPLLDQADAARRRSLRVALGRAAASPRATDALRAALVDAKLSETALLELLRALGGRVVAFDAPAAQALSRLAAPGAAFRVRYLRTLPAAALASRSDSARSLLASALTQDRDVHVRAQAARAIATPQLFKKELQQALGDREVRVREAAAQALARPSGAFASKELVALLSRDRWPIVRSAAALALAEFSSDAAVDSELGRALEDGSWLVRRDVAAALGKRGARAQAEPLRARLDDRDERFEVRVAAARSLGEVCDRSSLGVLTSHARKLADPMTPTELRAVSLAALASLVRLAPDDLASRLEPLLAAEAPAPARAAGQAALETVRDQRGKTKLICR
jgi:HEAT repeat protein